MYISGIRPVSGFYSGKVNNVTPASDRSVQTQTDTGQQTPAPEKESGVSLSISQDGSVRSFGSYDVARQQRPSEGIRPTGIDKAFSQAEVAKAVDVMKRDGALHKYQTFVSSINKEPLIRQSGVLENFTL